MERWRRKKTKMLENNVRKEGPKIERQGKKKKR
jgi:hypothetical protein